VAKTAKKLVLELQKCYPAVFETNIVSSLKSEEDRMVCKAVLRNDEDEIQRILSSYSAGSINGQSNNMRRSGIQDETKTTVTNSYSKNSNIQVNSNKELSIIGKEILQNNPAPNSHHQIMTQAMQ
jgi:hypothetical protein